MIVREIIKKYILYFKTYRERSFRKMKSLNFYDVKFLMLSI